MSPIVLTLLCQASSLIVYNYILGSVLFYKFVIARISIKRVWTILKTELSTRVISFARRIKPETSLTIYIPCTLIVVQRCYVYTRWSICSAYFINFQTRFSLKLGLKRANFIPYFVLILLIKDRLVPACTCYSVAPCVISKYNYYITDNIQGGW